MWPARPPWGVRKADIVLAVLVVAAVVATAVGGLSGDRWTDERTLRFATHEEPLSVLGPQPAGGAGARFEWPLPANATAANLTFELAFSGQAFSGGSATVSVRITTPDGRSQPPVTRSWTIPQGATSAATTVNATVAWDEAPESFRDTTDEGHARLWTRPLVVVVVVERPADVALGQYAFTATASGTLFVFAAS
jgi:hypothetical protein